MANSQDFPFPKKPVSFYVVPYVQGKAREDRAQWHEDLIEAGTMFNQYSREFKPVFMHDDAFGVLEHGIGTHDRTF